MGRGYFNASPYPRGVNIVLSSWRSHWDHFTQSMTFNRVLQSFDRKQILRG